MNGKAMRILLLVALVSLLVGPAFAADDYIYTGVKKCKTCHKPAKIGGQYGIWLEPFAVLHINRRCTRRQKNQSKRNSLTCGL